MSKIHSDVVVAHYSSHPNRFLQQKERLMNRGVRLLSIKDALCNPELITTILVKTREVTEDVILPFKRLRKIIVLDQEPWMVNLTNLNGKIHISCLTVERGFDVAEHALLLLLTGLKKSHRLHEFRYRFSLRNIVGLFYNRLASETRGAHNWTRISTDTLNRKKLGIVGYGLIGRAIHRRLKGFSVEVYYCNRKPYSTTVEKRIDATFLPLKEIFSQCDVIFLQLPGTEDTKKLIQEEIFSSTKKGLYLINCGRAHVIDQHSLYQSLRSGRVAFYGSDVFWREPRPLLDPFRLLKNCLITPHMAESVAASKIDIDNFILEELRAYG